MPKVSMNCPSAYASQKVIMDYYDEFSHHLAGGLQMCEEKSEAQEDVTVDSALLVMPCPVYPVFNACLRDKLNYIPDQSTESWPKRTRKKVAAVRLELCFQNLFMAAFIHLKLLCAHTHDCHCNQMLEQ